MSIEEAALGASSSEEEILVQIIEWDSELHMGLSSDLTPSNHKFQGGLGYVRGLRIDGRLLSPRRRCTRLIRLWLSPFGPDLKFGRGGLDEVGQINFDQPGSEKATVRATLLLPESALFSAVICMHSVWRYLRISTFDEHDGRASVSAFSFSAGPTQA
jgi:hypothetical protein